jgi:enoyl-CoA hydratase/carnithine racemase
LIIAQKAANLMKVSQTMIARIQSRRLTVSASNAALINRAIRKHGAPPSIAAIPAGGLHLQDINPNAGAMIRQIGCTRRVFLLQPHLTAAEMEGLAYRIATLTKNDGINSILIATDETDDVATGALPAMILARDGISGMDVGFPPAPGHTYFVAGGYDPIELYKTGDYRNKEAVAYLLRSMRSLTTAIAGNSQNTKIPVICMPHGAVLDGGFAFCRAAYVIATGESTFQIRNGSRGLTLDPVGLSHTLPRLGREFDQISRNYPVGMILGLTGYEADAFDMVETGLATNFVERPSGLSILEHALSEIPPWKDQALIKKPLRYYGDPEPTLDHNAQFRNVAVADSVHCFASYRANGSSIWTADVYGPDGDVSLDPDGLPQSDGVSSDLVDIAAAFSSIFEQKSLKDILEGVKEVANRTTNDPEEQEGIDLAADFSRRMHAQSPLALAVTHRLLQIGANKNETFESCIAREERVQAKLLAGEDFAKWAAYTSTANEVVDGAFRQWKHKSIADVSKAELDDILED